MASTTKTTNLELSQFVGTDKPAWLTDYNGDMQKIDNGYKKLEDANTATQADLDATKQDLSGSKTDINDVKADVQALEAQDITLGNRLTVLEGNYDTMHHEVATLAAGVETLQAGHIYSTDEKIVGKWIDGKNVYERTIADAQVTQSADGERTTYRIELPLDIYTISVQGYFETDANGHFLLLSNGIAVNSELKAIPQFSSGVLKTNNSHYCYVTFNNASMNNNNVTKIVATIQYFK